MTSTTTSHRWQILLGIGLTLVVALGSALAASGASRGTAATSASAAAAPAAAPDCVAIGTLVAAAKTVTDGAARHVPAATARAGVDTAWADAAKVARTTTSDDAREMAQNLADDLAAYRVGVAVGSSPDRAADTLAAVNGHVAALKHLCGR